MRYLKFKFSIEKCESKSLLRINMCNKRPILIMAIIHGTENAVVYTQLTNVTRISTLRQNVRCAEGRVAFENYFPSKEEKPSRLSETH